MLNDTKKKTISVICYPVSRIITRMNSAEAACLNASVPVIQFALPRPQIHSEAVENPQRKPLQQDQHVRNHCPEQSGFPG